MAGNAIGTDSSGLLQLGNTGNGISLGSSSNTIGGSGAGAANIIEFNGTGSVGAGVELVGNADHDLILSNAIYANAGLGINFGSGPTPNHAPGTPGRTTTRITRRSRSPRATASQTFIQGSLYEAPNSNYLIQFFSSPTQDPSGHGQGKLLVGTASVTTDANGNASFTEQLPSGTTPGQYISATATSGLSDTSEFSTDVSVQGQINLDLTGSATPDPVAAGGDVTYTLVVANQGYVDAHHVVLNDVLPGGVAVGSVTTSQGFVSPNMQGGAVSVNLGTIAAGASATVTIVVQTNAGSIGTIIDSATVSSQETDPQPARRIGDDLHDRPGRGRPRDLARRGPGDRPGRRRPDLHDDNKQPGPERGRRGRRRLADRIRRGVRFGHDLGRHGLGFGRPGRRQRGQSGGECFRHGDRGPPGPRRRQPHGNGDGLRRRPRLGFLEQHLQRDD